MRLQPMLAPLPPLPGSVDAGIDSPGHSPHEQIILHLDERGFAPFHPALAEAFGHKAAIFVGMALYWTRHSLRNTPQRGGWFNMSMPQWQQAIGLTRSEQATVRETLMLAGILEEELIGSPAVMNYRINVAALVESLSSTTGGLAKPTWDAVGSWLRSCKVYYKPLADVAGNIAAGLYLSFLLQCHRDRVRLGQLDNGCISVSQDEIAVALNLGTKVQRNARDRLKKAGLIQECGAGGALVRLNFDALLSCLRGQAIKPLRGRAKKQSPLQQPEASVPLQQRPQAPSETAAGLLPSDVRPAKQPPEIAAGPRVDLSGLGIVFGQLSLNLARPAPAPQPIQRSRDLLMAFLADEPAVRPLVGNRQVEQSGDAADATAHAGGKSNPVNGLAPALGPGNVPTNVAPKNAVSCNLEIAETCKQELPFPATYIQEGIPINTTTTAKACEEVREGSSSGVKNSLHTAEKTHAEQAADLHAALIFPAKLSDSQRVAVASVVKRLPESERQAFLDELHGTLANGKVLRNPAAWLSGIIAKKDKGELIALTYAAQVAADRELASGNKPSMFGENYVESKRWQEMSDMSFALEFLKGGHVFLMRTTGSLVKLDTTINEIRIKRAGWPDWRITRDAGPLVKAIRANDVEIYEGGEE